MLYSLDTESIIKENPLPQRTTERKLCCITYCLSHATYQVVE